MRLSSRKIPAAGWAVAAEGGETIALDVAITPELRREGLAREFVRQVQDARKGDGLQVSDRITVLWAAADPELVTALTQHAAMISAEVLAGSIGPLALGTDLGTEEEGAGEAGPGDGAGNPGDDGTAADDGTGGDHGTPRDRPRVYRHDNDDLGLTFWIRPS